MSFTFLQKKNPVNVGIYAEVEIYNIIMCLNNKNVLEYVEILRSEHFMIHDNEGDSSIYLGWKPVAEDFLNFGKTSSVKRK